MSLEAVAGATYGPHHMRISPEKVAEYVVATGDEPDRWTNCAPPSFAAALLFAVAPRFLDDPRVRPYTGVLVHVDQSFTWHGPLIVGDPIAVSGRVDKVRERGGRFFVSFSAEVVAEAGERLLDAKATFLMGRADTDKIVDAGEAREAAVWRRELNEIPSPQPWTDTGDLASLAKSASRVDLVRYAAASGDYNPIHFDHDAARGAGLPGIVVHGLLMAAWALQAAASVSARPDPIAHAKFRFKNLLLPATQATATASVHDVTEDEADAQLSLVVAAQDQELVTGRCVVRLER